MHTLESTNSIVFIQAWRKAWRKEKIKHPINNTPLAFHSSHSLEGPPWWEDGTQINPGISMWMLGGTKAKTLLSLLSCFSAVGNISLEYWWVQPHPCICLGCIHWREQSGLIGYDGTGHKVYKRCCICGIHVNNSSAGKPYIKARITFHSKDSILFSATWS